MVIKYEADIKEEAIENNLNRLVNQVYKLLPTREEGLDWNTPLFTIMEELAGMDRLLIDQHDIFFSLMSKLEGLFTLTQENDFFQFRRTIFECLSLVSNLKNNVRLK